MMANTIKKSKESPLREKAEELLNAQYTKRGPVLTEADRIKLIHEQEVHQIELELQNEELVLAKERAELAEEKYIELYDFAPIGYVTLSKGGNIAGLNFSAARLLGKERSRLLNTPFAFFVSENSLPDFKLFLKYILKSKAKETCEVLLSIDRSHSIYVHMEGILSQNGEQCFLSILDLTDRKQAEKNLIAKEKAEESDRFKTAFLQNMSHEIRSPLNVIMGFSELLVEQYNNKQKLEHYSQIIHQRCSDLLNIINDILDVAKIESGQLTVNAEVCNLHELFDELNVLFSELQKKLNKQHIHFDIQVISDPVITAVVIDKVKLKQIFINLISNAFKFTDNGRIEAGCRIDNNSNLLFFVSDTGIGIQLDRQDTAFEPFTQLNQKAEKNLGGTGLGLPIVKGLIDLLGGSLFLDSKPGVGSTFSFIIPFKTIEPLPPKPLIIEETTGVYFPGKVILIVEDDAYNAEYLKEVLAITGAIILHTFSGREAVEIALSNAVDIILMDIRLPDMDGYEATRQIKQQKPGIEIIAQTAYAAPQDKQKAFEAGCDDYITKPSAPDLLLAMISRHLAKS